MDAELEVERLKLWIRGVELDLLRLRNELGKAVEAPNLGRRGRRPKRPARAKRKKRASERKVDDVSGAGSEAVEG